MHTEEIYALFSIHDSLVMEKAAADEAILSAGVEKIRVKIDPITGLALFARKLKDALETKMPTARIQVAISSPSCIRLRKLG